MSCQFPAPVALEESMVDRQGDADPLVALVDAARGGDEAATGRLYAHVRPRLLRMALALGVDPDGAGDLVQETLWSAHKNLDRFDAARASFEGWLGTILVRRTRNRWRSAARGRRLRKAFAASARTSIEPGSHAVEARLTLRRLLEPLTRRQREVVALYEIDGLSADEVAGILGISPAGVRSMARDARRRLAEEHARTTREELP
jgi:RNA polymerase sigma-70 factor (ECF subfamily)